MNWKHVKNLFLLLLIAVNLLLFYFVYSDYSETAFTDPVTAENVAALLRADGISVSETLLTKKNDTAKTLSVPYDREQYLLTAAAVLLGAAPDGIYLLPNGIRAETADGESAVLLGDLTISYRGKDSGNAAAEVCRQPSAHAPLSEEALETAVKAFSALLDLPEETVQAADIYAKEGFTFLTITQSADGIPFSGITCTFGMTRGALVYAEGRHFFGAPQQSEEAPLLNRVNILLKERERGTRGTVTDISLCYALYEATESESLLFVPAYTVTYADGSVSTVNAISGDIVLPLA